MTGELTKGPSMAENVSRRGVKVPVICPKLAEGEGFVKNVVTMFPSIKLLILPESNMQFS